jgi:hypothetical protein
MIIVHSKSNAESTSEAISDNELENKAAKPFAAKRRMFTITLI